MNITKPLLAALLLLSGLAFSAAVAAQAQPPRRCSAAAAAAAAAPPSMGTEYTEKGADTCLHVPHRGVAVSDLSPFSRPSMRSAPTSARPLPRRHLQCEACHGPGAKHAEPAATRTRSTVSSRHPSCRREQRNKFCLDCHRGNARTGWHASTHESNNLACTNCHKIHAERDPVLAKATQPEVCYKCHKQATRGLHQAVRASGALRQDGLQRLP